MGRYEVKRMFSEPKVVVTKDRYEQLLEAEEQLAALQAENERLGNVVHLAELLIQPDHKEGPQLVGARTFREALLRCVRPGLKDDLSPLPELEDLNTTRQQLAALQAERDHLREAILDAANLIDHLGGNSKYHRKALADPNPEETNDG